MQLVGIGSNSIAISSRRLSAATAISAMAYPVTADGLSLDEVSRRCLRNLGDYFGELAEGEPPPTESDLEEMQAEEEGWGHQWRAEKEEERFQQAEYEARDRKKCRKRKREEEYIAKWTAETAQSEKEEQELEGMLANDERELKREAEWAAFCDFHRKLKVCRHRLQKPWSG